MRPRLLDLFEQRVLRLERPLECWGWAGAKNNLGYAQLWYGERRMVYAHRFSYEQWVGEIPDGLVIDHLCRNPSCSNPFHLEAVTHQQNIKRGRAGQKTSCNYGHDWTDLRNVYVRANGKRWCAACARERARLKYVAA